MSMLITHSYLPARVSARAQESVAVRAEAPAGHSRAEIAALVGTMLLLIPFGLLLLFGL
jgi:hypothetical protein